MSHEALIVEDERDTGDLLAEVLRRRGYEPTVLAEGKPAVPWTREHQPELVLLDLMLPDVDGYQVCENLKLDRETNRIPVIMVTARDQHQDKVHGLQVGANSYLTKPFTLDQLDRAISHVRAWQEDLRRNGTEGDIQFQLQSDTRYLDQLNKLLASLFLYTRLSPAQIRELVTAVRELGANAIEWGHQNQLDRLVTVSYRIDAEKVTIIIRDSGAGFDPQHLPHAASVHDPAGHLMVREMLGLREGGYGILKVRGLVDDLSYNEAGNEVRLTKFFALPGTGPQLEVEAGGKRG